MKVLLLGATGNLGSRLLPALQAHGHKVVVFVRSESKLKQLVPSSVVSKATIATGNASNSNTVREALVNNRCDALVNSAGQASIFPWQDPRMQDIIQAVTTAAVEASKEMGRPIRAWFLGGMTALDYPGFGGIRLAR
jgi:nucleoside-diphosphate-sugar epimerase